MAGAGSALVAQTGAILAAQQSFDATIRQAWYASPTSGLEATLAALNYQDDLAEAAKFSSKATVLAQASSSEDFAPWATFYAARTAAREDDAVEPLAALARFQRAGDPNGQYAWRRPRTSTGRRWPKRDERTA